MRERSAGSRDLDKRAPAGSATTIDWARIHQRLDAIQAALQGRMDPDPGEIQSILRTRARLLAREPEGEQRPHESINLVEFLLAHERYAVEARRVHEIQPLRELTPLPCAPPFVLGLINVRGHILSVIDIKKFFGLPEKGLTDLNKVIVVRADQTEIGFLADDILGIPSIPLEDLQPSLPGLTGVRAEFVRGLTKDSVVVLDVERILSDCSTLMGKRMPGPSTCGHQA